MLKKPNDILIWDRIGLGINDSRLAEELPGKLAALEEGVIASDMREHGGKICALGVAANEEAQRDIALDLGGMFCDLEMTVSAPPKE